MAAESVLVRLPRGNAQHAVMYTLSTYLSSCSSPALGTKLGCTLAVYNALHPLSQTTNAHTRMMIHISCAHPAPPY